MEETFVIGKIYKLKSEWCFNKTAVLLVRYTSEDLYGHTGIVLLDTTTLRKSGYPVIMCIRNRWDEVDDDTWINYQNIKQ